MEEGLKLFLRPLLSNDNIFNYVKLVHIIFFIVAITGCINANEEINLLSTNHLAQEYLDVNLDSAIYYANQTLIDNESKHKRYYAHYLIAYAYDEKQKYLNALQHYLLALKEIPSEISYDNKRVSINKNLGRIAEVQKDFISALKFYDAALKYVDNSSIAGVLYNKANTLKAMGDYEEAIMLFKEALSYAVENQNFGRQARITNLIGIIFTRIGDQDEARNYFWSIISSHRYKEYPEHAGIAYQNIAHSFILDQDSKQAIKYLNIALEFELEKDKFITYMDLGKCYTNLGELDKAELYLEKAHSLYPLVEKIPEHMLLFRSFERLYKLKGDLDQRDSYSDKYHEEIDQYFSLSTKIRDKNSAAKFRIFLDNYFEKEELKSSLISWQNALLMLLICFAIYWVVIFYKTKLRSYQYQKKLKKLLQ